MCQIQSTSPRRLKTSAFRFELGQSIFEPSRSQRPSVQPTVEECGIRLPSSRLPTRGHLNRKLCAEVSATSLIDHFALERQRTGARWLASNSRDARLLGGSARLGYRFRSTVCGGGRAGDRCGTRPGLQSVCQGSGQRDPVAREHRQTHFAPPPSSGEVR